MSSYIAIDVGGTQIRVAVYGENGAAAQNLVRTPTMGKDGTPVERLIDLVAGSWPSKEQVAGIGIAAPGPIDPRRGIVLASPNIPTWVNLPLQQILEDRFSTPVYLGNDANLAALGEWHFGAGQGHHNLLYITVSTGIGSGIVCDDHLLIGETGLAAEFGHIILIPDGPICSCGHRGHLEALASGPAIARFVKEELRKGRPSSLADGPELTALEVSRAAHQGDALAVEALERAGRYLGIGLANFVHLFNPSMIIFGGGVSMSGSFLFEPMKQILEQAVISPEYVRDLVITTAALGDSAGLLGALALARSAQQKPFI